ncbi:Uncharacterised protein [Acinetobacter baumannii]|nr:Uncharacterised protein [Acinetobacter baumannii]
MQLRHLGDEVQSQPGALAPAGRARQRVEAFGEARQGVVGNRRPLVEQAQGDTLAVGLGEQAKDAAGRGEVEGVVEQVGQRLAQQELLAANLAGTFQAVLHPQSLALDTRRLAFQQGRGDLPQVDLADLLQALPLLHLGQAQQALDQLLQALALAGDVADEARPLLGRHLAVEQLGGATDRRQWALQFVGQGMHVALDVVLAFQLRAHAFHRVRQLRHLAAAIARQLGAAPLADRLCVLGEAPQRAAEPPGEQAADQQPEGDQPGTEPGQAPLRAVDVGLQAAVRLGHRNHPDDLPAILDRRRHVHHRGIRVVRVFAAGARAVLAPESQVDVVPARIVLADGHPGGVQQHLAAGVGDVDAVVHRLLAQAPDIRLRHPLAVVLEHLRQVALCQGAVLHVLAEDLGEQVGGVHQGFLGGLAHAGAHFVHHRAQHEVAGETDEQEVDQEDPNAERHQAWSGL